MAQTATMRRFEIALADSDRGHYVDLELRVAQHPSETDRALVARVVVRALEDREGVEFTRGLSVTDEPTLWQRNLRGELEAWIEVGHPSPERLHKAQKACGRVAVYAWKRVDVLARELREAKIHRLAELELYALDEPFLESLAATLDRTNRWALSKSGGTIYLDVGTTHHEGVIATIAMHE